MYKLRRVKVNLEMFALVLFSILSPLLISLSWLVIYAC